MMLGEHWPVIGHPVPIETSHWSIKAQSRSIRKETKLQLRWFMRLSVDCLYILVIKESLGLWSTVEISMVIQWLKSEHHCFCLFTYTEIITLYQNTIEIYFLLISRLKISILQKSPTFGHRHSLKKKLHKMPSIQLNIKNCTYLFRLPIFCLQSWLKHNLKIEMFVQAIQERFIG